MSAAEAIAQGADYLVVVRPIRTAPDPITAAERVIEEIAASLSTARLGVDTLTAHGNDSHSPIGGRYQAGHPMYGDRLRDAPVRPTWRILLQTAAPSHPSITIHPLTGVEEQGPSSVETSLALW